VLILFSYDKKIKNKPTYIIILILLFLNHRIQSIVNLFRLFYLLVSICLKPFNLDFFHLLPFLRVIQIPLIAKT